MRVDGVLRGRQARRAALATLTALSLGAALAAPARAQGQGPAQAPAQAQVLPDFTDLVERVGPAVVNIRTLERARAGNGNGRGGPEMDPGLEEFFRRFGIPLPGRPDPRRGPPGGSDEPQQRGVGSGFILSADGYVMTNAHVVEGADEVIVTLTDKRELKARIVGADTRTDVAVVKIDAAGLPFVRIGDVGRLRVGEWVVAIGSPFGLDNTVTAGIVSAKQRDTGDYLPFIQTDVAINPGNSGGPLLNMRGEVVGINSQIYSRSGGFMGISFAIPIDEAIRVADQLRTNGRVVRGRIGVQIAPVTKEVAESIGLGKPIGALVQGVEAGGPAEKAGIEPGDIITKVDGKPVERSGELPRVIGGTKPGTRTTLQVFRRGNYRDLAVTVAEIEPEKPRRAAQAESAPRAAAASPIGLSVSDLGDAQRRELKVRGGVRVESVEGAAARAGLREGDVILAMDNTEITSARQFTGLVEKADKSKPLTLLVRRGDQTNYLIVRPSGR
ncbi:DegQ family serine endoprotease [Azohydromonas caseinilytica]|uniref:Probable periplasmic serine endoprotease DegP-like n=1 Tax=Azohydromonas caseinilytica TaxID=2728836 RepID=A0A848F6Q2_9BURK|nr:DegQ family serine endoprotease [Azohydromonas caseinilytica]NML15052.1 DegQ family serine endoprotease [Azohydromonas caseinilytica]